ncbi:MAG TPA: hypothetical protein VMF69_06550 [Gemmataceae bacterium]|nr:hypothetical protein [Gemmataceae bacterium]
MEVDWYQIVQDATLFQGDILLHCPVFVIAAELSWPQSSNAPLEVDIKDLDLIVMTQTCDLQNNKVEDVLLAQMVAWPQVVSAEVQKGNPSVQSRNFRKQLVEGNIPGFSLLHKREEEPSLPWSVVDFHRLFTLPKAFLSRFAASLGPRLRLRSPYREHLAQAFARYFMRVGLPHDARTFEKEGDVKP